jgi:hypothetical protein
MGEKLAQLDEGIASIEIVGINGGEWFGDGITGTPDCVAGSPRLFSPFGEGISVRKILKGLKNVIHRNAITVFSPDLSFEGVFKIMPDNEDDTTETGPNRIENGIIEHGFPGWSNRIDLFKTAVSGSHTGSENEESGVHCAHYG